MDIERPSYGPYGVVVQTQQTLKGHITVCTIRTLVIAYVGQGLQILSMYINLINNSLLNVLK